ncbi:hypothetical protein [Arsenicibacter rosenii]|uniref:Uncharacterized protein n=1 Tax=Arsenicibacter rosenii TaxID=1750698 RepID=A0A1S2VSS5_9BACT|nr:hypothetical protein [Arsenicibacter rosenii]OIN60968.1 hypothetical protein BLX24_02475 [Arsenicibacter rosenii]
MIQRIGATANYSGTYTVKATNNDGCLGRASVQVVVAPASCTGITASISAPAAITAGQTLTRKLACHKTIYGRERTAAAGPSG